MIDTSEARARAKTAREADDRTKRRAEQAQIVSGLQAVLEPDEHLMGFTRGTIAGGLRGKLTVGFEALFAPDVNIGLTERRVVLQHIQPDSGKPNDILPHSFPLAELQAITFSDIETFGGDPEARISLRIFNDQHFRLRCRGAEHVAGASTIAELFGSLTSSGPRARTSPTQSICPHCDRILDRVSPFCPYCGAALDAREPVHASPPAVGTPTPAPEPAAAPVPAAWAPEPGPPEKQPREWATDEAAETSPRRAPQDVDTEGHDMAAEPASGEALAGGETPE